jgi:protein TonB
MFEQTFVNMHAQARRPWTVAASLTLQTGLVALAVILPMFHPEILHPNFQVPTYLPMRVKPQPVPMNVPVVRSSISPRVFNTSLFTAPNHVPRNISMAMDAPEISAYSAFSSDSGPIGIIPGIGTALPENVRPLPPQPHRGPVTPEPPKGPVSVSRGVQSARLTFGPRPTYPALAKAARVQGTVRIQAIIAMDGAIKNLKVIGGPPLLIAAAVDAVKQWRYQATLLNGSAVEVITEIDVNFTLSQ